MHVEEVNDCQRRVYFKIASNFDVHEAVFDKQTNMWSCSCKGDWYKPNELCRHIRLAQRVLKKRVKA